jgi:hypothetical protein
MNNMDTLSHNTMRTAPMFKDGPNQFGAAFKQNNTSSNFNPNLLNSTIEVDENNQKRNSQLNTYDDNIVIVDNSLETNQHLNS